MPAKLKESFGARLRRLRAAAGLTQAALARRVGVTGQAIWLFEADRKGPSWGTAQRLADALGVTTEQLR